MYIPDRRYFKLQEWLPRKFYETMYPIYGARLWGLFNADILKTQVMLRERFGPCIMNTWHSTRLKELYGYHQWRGYRDDTSPYIEKTKDNPFGNISQHRFGAAADSYFTRFTAEEIREEILRDPFHPDFKYITRIEDDVPWLHIDIGNWDKYKHGILVFGSKLRSEGRVLR